MRTCSEILLLALTAFLVTPSASATVIVTAPTLNSVEGTLLNGTLTSFTDDRAGATVSDLTAVINWGDATISAGTITAAGSGIFDIAGAHTYFDEGTFGTSFSVIDSVDTSTGNASGLALIADAPLNLSTSAFSFVPGVLDQPTVASFTDGNPFAPISDFTAIIDWGDGTISPGTITAGPGNFQVSAGHTYASAGDFSVTVNVDDVGGSTASGQLTATSPTATPEPGPLVLTGLGMVTLLWRRARQAKLKALPF